MVEEIRERTIDYLTAEEVLAIPEEHLPLMVLSSCATSPFAFGIINIRKAIWNHFMWMHRPGYFASQNWVYEEVPIEKYLGFDHRLKFWYNPNWTEQQKTNLIFQIAKWLNAPKFRTRYDLLALVGQALKKVWIENPATRICSDYGSLLRESGVDLSYDLKHPAPDQVDNWLENYHPKKYVVYGRYAGE